MDGLRRGACIRQREQVTMPFLSDEYLERTAQERKGTRGRCLNCGLYNNYGMPFCDGMCWMSFYYGDPPGGIAEAKVRFRRSFARVQEALVQETVRLVVRMRRFGLLAWMLDRLSNLVY